MTVNKEDILVWLTQLGTDWVGIATVYTTYNDEHDISFWDRLDEWHDGAYITKRHADAKFNPAHASYQTHESIEQYKLTQKAIRSLEEE
jgi:hypothetical protein